MSERSEKIVEMLKKEGKLSVSELSSALCVCEMTIRRDLKELETEGRIKRYNGGAMIFMDETDFPFNDRKLLHSSEKANLAKMAAECVNDNSVVYIDSSSTCTYIIPHLAEKKGITLVTNSVTALVLAVKYQIPCIMAGGECFGKDLCTVGSFTSDMLKNINVDIAFFSSRAISEDGIISDADIEQTAVRKEVMKNAEKSVFLFIKSKQDKKSVYIVCKSEDVYKVILG